MEQIFEQIFKNSKLKGFSHKIILTILYRIAYHPEYFAKITADQFFSHIKMDYNFNDTKNMIRNIPKIKQDGQYNQDNQYHNLTIYCRKFY